MTGISFYCFLWRLISVRRVRASNGRQNRFFYRSHRNGQSRKNIVFMRLCGVSGIHFLRHGEQIILLFFISAFSFFIYAGICAEFAIAPQPIIATLIFSDTETPPFQVYLSIHNNTKTGAKSKLRHKKYILFYFFV